MNTYFDNKVAVVTGATSGLGKQLTLDFLVKGCHVAAIGRNQDALKELSEKGGDRCMAIQCDISDYDACQDAFRQIESKWGRVNFLINNAGITNISKFRPGEHVEMTRKLFEVNFFGSVYCTELAFNSLVQSKGSIVNISSVAGYSPLMGRTAYSASKHAMHGFFDTLRSELKSEGVHVMMVCPTFIQTAIRSESEQKVQGETLSPEYVSMRILKGIIQRKRLLLIGKTATFAYWVNKFFPGTYEKIMIRNQKNKF